MYSALGFEVEGLGFGCWGFGFGAHVGTKDLVIRAIGFVIKAWAKGRYEGLLRTVTLRVHVRFHVPYHHILPKALTYNNYTLLNPSTE